MRLVEIIDINKERKDVPLYYRNDYQATGCFEATGGTEVSLDLNFTVETLPTGEKQIRIEIKEPPNYPTLSLIKALREEILILHGEGKLL